MNVLIADDDPLSLHLLKTKLLQWQYTVIACSDGMEAWHVLQSDTPPRLAILDWMMPGLDGLEICQKVREQIHAPYIYLLLLTARGDTADLVKGLEAGADDYLIKPFDVKELKVRLRTGRRVLDLEEKLISAQETLKIQATHDHLTGVMNRAAVLEHFQRELVRGQREQTPVSVILIDLDYFKAVNDTHGHLAGDVVLVEACQRMRHCIRPYDVLGRLGGEEFLLVLPGSDTPNALGQAERLREAIGMTPYQYNDIAISMTCSQGVTTWSGHSTPDMTSLIRTADGAMYLAKCSGRDRVEFIQLERMLSPQPSSAG